MNRYFLHLAYDGTPYHGWQRQPNDHSVQAEIEKALSTILQTNIAVMGCGRTDTGVHAKSFYAHFELSEAVEDPSLLTHKLNTLLHSSIVVFSVLPVNSEAHARFDATSRSYEYRTVSLKDPFNVNKAYRYPVSLDIEAMNIAAAILLEYNEFGSFCKARADNYTDLCDVTKAVWKKIDGGLVFEITANRFLRNMVRAIVGTLLEVGQGKMQPEEMRTILDQKDRQAAGRSVPAHGLYLTEVVYPKHIFL
ncbi:MAG: tRNA pseudouridine38-40 synthase [Granulosicoccus sp.]